MFDRVCENPGIDHRLTKHKHPCTNGQVERMNRTFKEVHRYYYDSNEQLRDHLVTFLIAYNFEKRLKTLSGLTPYDFIYQQWQMNPNRPECDSPMNGGF